jgi:hypothetical protein
VLGQDIVFNERVTTGAEGQTQVLFVDQSTLSVGPNTDMVINEFVFDPTRGTGKLAANFLINTPTPPGQTACVGGHCPVSIAATVTLAIIGPIPGHVIGCSHPASWRAIASISTSLQCVHRAVASSPARPSMMRAMRGDAISEGPARNRGISRRKARGCCRTPMPARPPLSQHNGAASIQSNNWSEFLPI